jgi:hypothetical protein
MTRAEVIYEMRQNKYEEQAGRCFICGRPVRWAVFQLAHRIPQRKWCIEKWGIEVIHHQLNIAGVCGLECNSSAQYDPNSRQAEELAKYIKEKLKCGKYGS